MQEIPKPSFIIVGAAKCGTTTLAKILADHPQCCFSKPKEVAFFCSDEIVSRGWDWYKKHFSHYAGEAVTGEATPAYADKILHPETAKRIYEFNPDVKLIYIVRDPYERYVSAWRMHYRGEKHNARDGIDAYFEKSPRREADIKSCCYGFQLSDYLQYFPKENIHIAFLEDLAENPLDEMQKISRFIGIDPAQVVIKNRTGENRGDTYRTTAQVAEKMSQSGLTTFLKLLMPTAIRRNLYKRLFVKQVPTPREELSAQNMQIFWKIVEEDARLFLENHGKPADFWNLGVDARGSKEAVSKLLLASK